MNIDFLGNNIIIVILILWEIFWKGVGLWRSAKRSDLYWFIGVFLINLFGLVPLFYLWYTKQLNEVLRDFQHFFKSKFKKN